MLMTPSFVRNNFIDDAFDDFFHTPFWSDSRSSSTTLMNTDVTESDTGYQIDMDLPGFAKEDVSASLKDGYLTISAEHNTNNDKQDESGKIIRRERYQGTCKRSFYVGEEVEQEDIKARFKDGVLTLLVPKKEEKPKVEEQKFIFIEG